MNKVNLENKENKENKKLENKKLDTNCISDSEKDSEHETSDTDSEDRPLVDILDNSDRYANIKRETCKGIYIDLKRNKVPVLSTLLGIISHNYIRNYMLTGIDGVNYYGEAHLTRWNAWMHTLGMPFTIFGMVLWIPALFRLNPYFASRLMMGMYFFYGGHYLRINIFMTAIYFLLYYYPLMEGINYYSTSYTNNIVALKKKSDDIESLTLVKKRNETFNSLLIRGLGISTIALLFQEIAGHYYGGDIPSRWEAIPNAILYAKYFSVHHLFY